MKALIGAFNQEKALVGAFSVMVVKSSRTFVLFEALVLRLGSSSKEGEAMKVEVAVWPKWPDSADSRQWVIFNEFLSASIMTQSCYLQQIAATLSTHSLLDACQ